MTSWSSLSDGRAGALLGAAALAGLSAAAALGASAPWWAGAVAAAAVLAAGLAPRAARRESAEAGRPKADLAPRKVEREIDQIAQVLDRVARGDLEARMVPLPKDDHAREMAINLNRMLDIADAFVREVDGTLQAMSKGAHHRRLLPHGFHGDFARVASGVNQATLQMSDRVQNFNALTARFEARIVAVSETVTASAAALEQTAREVSDTVTRAQGGASSIAGAADAALGNVDSVAASAEQMDGAMAAVSDRAGRSAGMADRAVEQTRAAAQAVEALSAAATRIDEVVQMIKGVSDYTKLLAVNASVEAARAGDAGKGFAVVAAEVQSLATQSADATREAAQQIQAVRDGVDSAVKAMHSVSSTIDDLADTAKDTTAAVNAQRERIRDVATNMHDAAGSSRQVAGHVRDVSGAVTATEAAAREVLSAAHLLSEQASDLRLELETYLAEAKAA